MNILVSHQAAPHILQQNFARDYKNEDFFIIQGLLSA